MFYILIGRPKIQLYFQRGDKINSKVSFFCSKNDTFSVLIDYNQKLKNDFAL